MLQAVTGHCLPAEAIEYSNNKRCLNAKDMTESKLLNSKIQLFWNYYLGQFQSFLVLFTPRLPDYEERKNSNIAWALLEG
jgi:hypothetical protein